MARPVTPLMRLEEARVEWTAMRRNLLAQGRVTPTVAATVEWADDVVRNLGMLIDSTRVIETILGCADGVYSETVKRRMEEIDVRQQFRRSA